MNRSMLQLLVLFSLLLGVCTLILFLVLHHTTAHDFGINLGPFRLRPNYQPAAPAGTSALTGDGILDQEQIKKLLSDTLDDIDHDRIDEAEDKVRTILVFDPNNLQALTIMGRIFYSDKRYMEAETVFRRQAKLSPGDPTVLNNLGSTLVRLNKVNEAINYLHQAWGKSPDSPEIIINLAGAYAVAGDRVQTMQMLRRAEKILGPALLPLAEDPCFDTIRNLAEFRRLLRQAAQSATRTATPPAGSAVSPGSNP